MRTHYFNTGVDARKYPPTMPGHVVRGGTVQIPFDVPNSVPENVTLLFCCDNPRRPEAENPAIVITEIYNTAMISKYAYFRRNPQQ